MRRDFSSHWVLAGGVDVKGGLPAEVQKTLAHYDAVGALP
jgi:hypothetical protein